MTLPELQDIGSRVAYARTHSPTGEMTREDLAAKLAGKTKTPITWVHLQMIEGNNLDPVEMGFCDAIATATGVDPRWLVGGKNRAPRILPVSEPVYVAPTKRKPGESLPVDSSTLGGRVRAARMAKGLSQKQLGKQIGMNNWMVSRIELNRFDAVHPLSAQALLTFLGIDEKWPQLRSTKMIGEAVWAMRNGKTPVEPKKTEVLPPRQTVKGRVVDNLVRPRLVTQVRINADESAFYLVCGRKVFQRDGAESQEPLGALAFNPRLMKGMLNDLTEAVRQYEDTFGPIR